jgi:EAL domain-containing protein (putative c-di-GMP-specific phosphodiesterase class I)
LDDEFSVVFQPKMCCDGKKIIGAEALVRWNNPVLGNVSPSEFIPIAEDSDIIHRISTWVYRKAFAMLADIQKKGFGDFILSVNVSPLQISKNTLINSLNSALFESEVSPRSIELEITEGMLLNTKGNSEETIAYLRQRGFKIAIDDFGTGYSSLSYLQELNLDSIKIDKSFIGNLHQKNAYSITKAIISLARSLELQTVAEGVETEKQLLIAKELGCDLIQGFYYSKPLFQSELLTFMKNHSPVCQ